MCAWLESLIILVSTTKFIARAAHCDVHTVVDKGLLGIFAVTAIVVNIVSGEYSEYRERS